MAEKSVLPQREHFLIIEDDKGRQEVLLREPTYSMGRSQHCDIRLRSQFVSRHHATLYRRIGEDGSSYYRIVDGDFQGKRSVNGLLINQAKTLTIFKTGMRLFSVPRYLPFTSTDNETSSPPYLITIPLTLP